MAETSGFWTTSGTPSGHQVSSYTQVIAAKAWAILAACAAKEGVAPGYFNELAGSVPGANTARITTGGAVVDGQWYENGANVDVTIPSAVGGGNTRIDRIVLRCTWANFEVEITRLAGTDAASPTAPAITQTPGTTYDIMLYQALVNTSGTVTLTDERVWAYSDRIWRMPYRQGGSSGSWLVAGSTAYAPAGVKVLMGAMTVTGDGDTVGNSSIVFPESFSHFPIVFATISYLGTSPAWASVAATGTGSASVNYGKIAGSSFSDSGTLYWLAIGPD